MTYIAARIATLLGFDILHRPSKAEWLRSLVTSDGAYADPEDLMSELSSTRAVVKTLRLLGQPIGDSEKTTDYIRSLRSGDGLCSSGNNILTVTSLCTDVLVALDTPDSRALASDSIPALRVAIESYVRSNPVKPIIPHDILSAMWSLSLVAPQSLNDEAIQHLRSSLEMALRTDPSTLRVQYLSTILEVHQRTDRLITPDLRNDLEQYARTYVLPYLDAVDSHGYPPNRFDLGEVYSALALATYLDVYWPPTGLRKHLELFETEKGWLTQWESPPSVQHTAYALEIAQTIEFNDYSPTKLASFLEDSLTTSDRPLNVAQIAFALRAYHAMGQMPPPAVTDQLRYSLIAQIEGQSDHEDLYRFAEVAMLLDWQVPDDVKSSMIEAIERYRAGAREPQPRKWATMQFVAAQEVVSPDELERAVFNLWDAGGFRMSLYARSPSLRGTRQALETLALINRMQRVNHRAIETFVWSCKADYGFSDLPAPTDVDPDLPPTDYTFEAVNNGLAVLDMLGASKTPPPLSSLALPAVLN